MQAVVQARYGPLTQLTHTEVATPEPAEGEVRLKVIAAGVDPSIWHLMTGTPYVVRLAAGFRGPRIATPGWDAAGLIDALGPGVTGFAVGDRVFGAVRGAFAQYSLSRPAKLAGIPDGVSFVDAAAIPTSGITALQAVRDHGKVQAGQHVAILGAGGGVGCFAVQLAAHLGAEVTGVCSTGKLDFVRSLGASDVLDYTQGDITSSGRRFDVIIDCAGNRSLRRLRSILAPAGTLVIVGGESARNQVLGIGRTLHASAVSVFTKQRLTGMFATATAEDLRTLANYQHDGALRVPVDRTFCFAEGREAIQYVRDGRPHGKVVVQIGQ